MSSSHEHYSSQSAEADLDSIRQYMDEAGRHELLTAEDEVALAKAIEAGVLASQKLASSNGDLSEEDRSRLDLVVVEGKAAKDKFINSNLRLVVSWARRYQNHGLDLLDLIQEGNAGLMHAVDKFDYHRGFKFSTYGSWWIRQSMTRALSQSRTIRLPVHMRDMVIDVNNARAAFFSDNARYPSLEELAEYSGYSPQQVENALIKGRDTMSLSTPVGEDGAELGDFIQDSQDAEDEILDTIIENEQMRIIRGYYEYLTDAERTVMNARYPLNDESPATLDKIGQDMNLTRESVRQIEKRALFKLRSLVHLGRVATKNELNELLNTA